MLPSLSPLIETRHVSKSFGSSQVLNAVDFSLDAGQSVAVVGENGAGKSTFAKIITGVLSPDAGEVIFENEPVSFGSPRDAIKAGVALIPQELAYVPQLTVAENLLVNRLPSTFGFTSPSHLFKEAERLSKEFELEVPVRRLMSELSLADRQIVEILKALSRDSRLIVLDEPTASLTEAESNHLYEILGRLGERGLGIVAISHRMDEVYKFFGRADVFRNGERVFSGSPDQTPRAELIRHMLGREKEELEDIETAPRGAPVLRIQSWSSEAIPELHDVSFEVAEGEVVSLFGVRGCGADTVADGLAGRGRRIEGAVEVSGRPERIFRNPRAARRAKVGFVPAERKRDGLVLGQSIEANVSFLVIDTLSVAGFVRGRARRRLAEDAIRDFDIRARNVGQQVGTLSGGNQQKVLLASRLAPDPTVLVLHEPTRGVDIGARIEIHRLLRRLAAAGKALLVITTDVEEAVAIADRLLIMREGRLVDEMAAAERSQARALRSAVGGAA